MSWLTIKTTTKKAPTQPAQKMIRLTPLAMVGPNAEGVYSLSQYGTPLTVTMAEWHTYSPVQIKVGTPERWREVTAYGKGLSVWYIATEA